MFLNVSPARENRGTKNTESPLRGKKGGKARKGKETIYRIF